MKKLSLLLIIIITAAMAAGCEDKATPRPDLPYDPSPDAVVVSIIPQSREEQVEYQRNEAIMCQIYGDGRVIWTNPLETGGEQVLEGNISADALRDYLHFINDKGFFTWANQVSSDVLPPQGVNSYTTIAVTVGGTAHTVSTYYSATLQGFDDIIAECQGLVSEPVLVEPSAGWLNAYETTFDGNRPYLCWPAGAPLTLRDAAAAGEYWLEGEYATFIWSSIHETEGVPLFAEGGPCKQDDNAIPQPGEEPEPLRAYNLVLQVPGINPFAPPPPATP
jgi:hypothetical protein